jgi:transposase
LKLVIERLRRMMFGAKSEKVVVQLEQLELRLEELESAQAERETAAERVVPAEEAKTRPARKLLPEDLPREVVTHLFHRDCCPDCGGPLHQFGEDVSEQLKYIPESFKVIRHVRPKFACGGCRRGLKRLRHRVPSNAVLPARLLAARPKRLRFLFSFFNTAGRFVRHAHKVLLRLAMSARRCGRTPSGCCLSQAGTCGSPGARKSMEIPEHILMGSASLCRHKDAEARCKRQTPLLPQAASLLKADLSLDCPQDTRPSYLESLKIAL